MMMMMMRMVHEDSSPTKMTTTTTKWKVLVVSYRLYPWCGRRQAGNHRREPDSDDDDDNEGWRPYPSDPHYSPPHHDHDHGDHATRVVAGVFGRCERDAGSLDVVLVADVDLGVDVMMIASLGVNRFVSSSFEHLLLLLLLLCISILRPVSTMRRMRS